MPRHATATIDPDTGINIRQRSRRYFFDNFNRIPLLDASYDIGDQSASDQSASIEAAMEGNINWFNPAGDGVDAKMTHATFGGVLMTTDGTASDQQAILPSTAAEVQGGQESLDLDTNRKPAVEFGIGTEAAIADMTFAAGLVLTHTDPYDVTTDADQVKVEYVAGANSGVFMIRHSIGGTDASIDTGITVAVSTEYFVKIKFYADRTFGITIGKGADPGAAQYFHVDSAMTDLLTLKPHVVVQETGGAEAINCRYIAGGVNLWE